ncbi:MAG: Potassium channel [Trichoglossum hirsutum]|nr:MAG: Potassium channel [Trichoglossum hirsutum]
MTKEIARSPATQKLPSSDEGNGTHWLAGSVVPVLAGTLGPFANALNFCAVIQPWRSEALMDKDADRRDIPDPVWLIAVNAVSVLFGVMANISFMQALRLVPPRGGHPKEREIHSEGERQTVKALLIHFGLGRLYDAFMRLGRSLDRVFTCRLLIVLTIVGWYAAAILLFVLVGLAAAELHIHSRADMAATQAYYYAIFAGGLYIIVPSILILTQCKALRTNRGRSGQNGKERLGRHKLMMWTIFFLLYTLTSAAVFAHIEQWYYLDGIYWVDSTLLTIGFGDFSPSTFLGRCLLFPYAMMGIVTLGIVVYSIKQVANDAETDSVEVSIAKWLQDRRVEKLGVGEKSEQSKSPKAQPPSGEDRFVEMRRDRRLASWIAFVVWGLAWVMLWLVGAAVFHASERAQGWTYFQSLYFAYVSLFVIGYGDFHPQGPFGKVFFVVWSLLAVPVVTVLVTTMAEAVGYIFFHSDLTGSHVRTHLANYVMKWLCKSDLENQRHHRPRNVLDNTDNERKKTHLLAQSIAQLLRHHLNQTHPKPLTLQEWEYFVSLIFALKSNCGGVIRDPPKSLQIHSQGDEAHHSNETLGKWYLDGCDWTSEHNPIMMSKPEIEWLLEVLMVELVGRLSEE